MIQKERISLFFKGIAMGAADVVPGVSGGTIAFITGIYEELVDSIGRIDGKAIKVLFQSGPMAFFKHVNGPFLLTLGLGIGVSIIALAKFITELLDTRPVMVWSFFFGLIIASAVFIGKDIRWRRWQEALSVLIGIVVAYVITTLTPSGGDVGLLYVFFSGAIAICAMILPGISGSFILLLLGSYATIFGAIGNFTNAPMSYAPIVLVFILGALTGLLSFSKALKYLFKEHRAVTIAVLTGFMIGSLAKVWPWKLTLSTRINSKGEEVPLMQENISPARFNELLGEDPQLALAVTMTLIGIAVVYLLSRIDMMREEA